MIPASPPRKVISTSGKWWGVEMCVECSWLRWKEAGILVLLLNELSSSTQYFIQMALKNISRHISRQTVDVCWEKTMAPHSNTLAWKIPWTEEPGRLQSMRSLRVGRDWATSISLFTFLHWRRKWQPTPVFWWAAVCGVAQSWTRLKWLSSSYATLRRLGRCVFSLNLYKVEIGGGGVELRLED